MVAASRVHAVLACTGALGGQGLPGCCGPGRREEPPLPPDREDGWRDWLREFGLWDDTHTEQQAYKRYLTFSRIKFGAAPREMWAKLFYDLLEFESALVFGSGHIGLVDMPFSFRVLDERPIHKTAIPYPK